MKRKPFDPSELIPTGEHPLGARVMMQNMIPGFPGTEPVFGNRPITAKENFKLLFSGKKPYWMPFAGWCLCDVNNFRPRLHPDNVATHLVFDDQEPYPYTSNTMNSSWFDLNWVYVPVAGGATVQPGDPKIEDMNDWKDLISMPDLDAMDFAGCAFKDKAFLETPQYNELGILSGFWERLISLMDVSGAAIALIDEDQQDAVKEFFDQYADTLIEYIRRIKQYNDIDGVLIHDDWGTQRNGFFSLDTAMEMLVPYLKKVTDAVHEMGMYFQLHSCGKNEALVPAYIAAGVDLWCPQPLNDIDMLSEKYKDAPIWFGQQFSNIPMDTPEDECIRLADEWFEKYKDRHVIPGFSDAPPAFTAELYRISRVTWENEDA